MINRNAFRSLNYGLYIVGAQADDLKAGCVVNTFQQVTSTPPCVSVALNKGNVTTDVILKSGRYTVSVLSREASMDLIGVFGFRASSEVDKYDGVAYEFDASGVPYVTEQSVAWFSVKVIQTVDVGTHYMFIGEVEQAEVLSDEAPMSYAYYHEVKRGKTPAKASSYVPKEEVSVQAAANEAAVGERASVEVDSDEAVAGERAATDVASEAEASPTKYAWQCEICGHIEYLDELPEGYECPLCGQGVEVFERIEA